MPPAAGNCCHRVVHPAAAPPAWRAGCAKGGGAGRRADSSRTHPGAAAALPWPALSLALRPALPQQGASPAHRPCGPDSAAAMAAVHCCLQVGDHTALLLFIGGWAPPQVHVAGLLRPSASATPQAARPATPLQAWPCLAASSQEWSPSYLPRPRWPARRPSCAARRWVRRSARLLATAAAALLAGCAQALRSGPAVPTPPCPAPRPSQFLKRVMQGPWMSWAAHWMVQALPRFWGRPALHYGGCTGRRCRRRHALVAPPACRRPAPAS